MSRSHGTGFPSYFECSQARKLYSRDPSEQHAMRAPHVVKMTGKFRPKPRGDNNGHPRKSRWRFQYECACHHVGWSNHIDAERQYRREFPGRLP